MNLNKLSENEIEELKNIIFWAISEGYNTNLTTKLLVNKLAITKEDVEYMEYLDENCNVGEKLTDK
jgi:hypothetical protein